MNTGHSAAIILAAGLSSRSASFKPLLPLGDGMIVARVISVFQENKVDVCLVVGHRRDEVRAAVKNINIIENPDYERGMFTSVQAGIRTLSFDCKAFFIMPVDIPLVRPATIARLLIEAEKYPDKIIYPVFGKRRGHPPLIPSSLIPSILAWNEDGGLKAVLSAHGNRAVEVAVPDGNILFDVDTTEDYEVLLQRFRRIHIPTTAECDVILDDICGVAHGIRQHSIKVTGVARMIGQALNDSGHKADLEVIQAAAMLHDIAKGQPEHDAAGGRMLQSLGFGYIGDIVAVHTDLGNENTEFTRESKIVYLADKFVSGTNLVPVEARYQIAGNKFAATPEIETNIARRKARALGVKKELESLIGCPLENIILK